MSSTPLPHSRDSERAILGCMISNQDCLNSVCSQLEESDFYSAEHQLIFRALKSAYCDDRPVDVHLIVEELKRTRHLESIGGMATIADLIHFSSMCVYIDEYIKLVKDKSILRKLIQTCKQVEKDAYSEPKDVHSTLDQAQNQFFKISQSSKSADSVLIDDFLRGKHSSQNTDFLHQLQQKQEEFKSSGSKTHLITGTPTGFIDLDKIINGINPSNLVILAGRPGMGKTALGLNILENICFKDGKSVGVFSLEMPINQLVNRVLSSQSEIETNKILQGNLSGLEFQKIVAAIKNIEHKCMVIDDQPNMNISNLRSRARRMKEKYDIQALMIDYLQLLESQKQGRFQENRQVEISEISRTLKNLSRELDIPILCLAQLSRKVEERPGHRPLMSDLRESGCLAYDTKVLLSDNTHKNIGEFSPNNNLQVISVNVDQLTVTTSNVYNAFCSGNKRLYSLTTKTGKQIKATRNHKFLTQHGWLPLSSLTNETNIFTVDDNMLLSTEQVINIEALSIQPVFDLSVTETNCFIANNFVVHNSIEQDADVVLFLLRREYYDPNDKPGLAEIIVAKNRHGSTGSIEIAYRNNIAQFANLLKNAEEKYKSNKRYNGTIVDRGNQGSTSAYGFEDFTPNF